MPEESLNSDTTALLKAGRSAPKRIDHRKRVVSIAERHLSATAGEIIPEFWEAVKELTKKRDFKTLAMLSRIYGYDATGGGISINNTMFQQNTHSGGGKSLERIIHMMEQKDIGRGGVIDAEIVE